MFRRSNFKHYKMEKKINMVSFLTLPANCRIIGLVLVLQLCSCATTPVMPESISDRAQARWDTLLSGDLEGAYQYLAPGYRSSVSVDQYTRQIQIQKVMWTDANYTDSECLESSCKVKISLDYSLLAALPGIPRYDGTQKIEENWIKHDETWWLVPKK